MNQLLCESGGLQNPNFNLFFVPCVSKQWRDCRSRNVKLKLEVDNNIVEKHPKEKKWLKVVPNVPGILICEVSSNQGNKTTETLLQSQQNIDSETKTYFIMLLLAIATIFLILLIVICITCVHRKSAGKNGVEGGPHCSAEDVIAKVHQFQRQKVQLVEKLEQGEYGVCWQAIVTGVAGDPAMEIQVMAKEAAGQYDQHALLTELNTYVRVGHHVNILNLLGIVRENMEQGELYIITEYCRFGNLKDFLAQNRYAFRDDSSSELLVYDSGNASSSSFTARRPFTKLDLLSWSYQIACGLQYLVTRELVYGNLSVRNALLGEGNIVKLSHFAVPRRVQSSSKLTQTNVLSLERMAPECLQSGTITSSSDVWSYGVLLWELFTLGCDPCWGMIPHGNMEGIFECGVSLPQPEYANDEVYQIMRSCWKHDPLARPCFTELCHKLYFMIPSNHIRNYEEMRNVYSCINAVDSAIL
ncbi:platelet-derived growth factor receptor alpha-like [Anopheles marshallii]|uniref:platelet-derived growth factor receptor alpha-like n=1 Tax=Anopheles marshallii TaxID=1521116 RepID=UPI00237A91C6|nr:platelet-derived growth factor receptor alpha-like [Anopheles marshallii]